MMDNGLSIQKELSIDVFGHEKEMFVLPEDIINVLEMNMIGQAVIGAYMACLHDDLKEKDELDLFAFVDPSRTHNPERKDFVPYLVNRLKEKYDRMLFLPYNPGKHWLLAAIYASEIYIMDSLPKTARYKAWEDSLTAAVKQFNAETGVFNKPPKIKHLLGVPKQSGGIECGYYVMRYMKDIINDQVLSFCDKWAVKSRSLEYNQQQIDEVRIELSEYLQGLA